MHSDSGLCTPSAQKTKSDSFTKQKDSRSWHQSGRGGEGQTYASISELEGDLTVPPRQLLGTHISVWSARPCPSGGQPGFLHDQRCRSEQPGNPRVRGCLSSSDKWVSDAQLPDGKGRSITTHAGTPRGSDRRSRSRSSSLNCLASLH